MSTTPPPVSNFTRQQSANCPECGAAENSCGSRLNELLVLEFTDPAYGSVHNLTVATFMLQHSSRLSREGWLYERRLLGESLLEKKSPDLIRRQNRDLVDSGKRTFKIKSKDGLPVINKTCWTKTILDVRAENPEVYVEDVTAWAKAVLKDAEALVVPETSEVVNSSKV